MKFEEGYFTNEDLFTIMHLYDPDISLLQDYNTERSMEGDIRIIKAYLQERIVGYAIINADQILTNLNCYINDTVIIASFIKELKRLKVKQFNGKYMDEIVVQTLQSNGLENMGRSR